MKYELKPTIIGLISDTHGLLREEAVEALRESELILHAGDVSKQGILDELRKLAPVVAVRGNMDTEEWAKALPPTVVVEAGPTKIFMLHNLQELGFDPAVAGFQVVVTGHSHQHSQSEKDGVLYINPGSAGPRRFRLPVTVARMDLGSKPWDVRFIDLEAPGKSGFDKKVRRGVG